MRRFLRTAVFVFALAAALGVGGGSMAAADPVCTNDANPLACACGAGGESAQSTACSTDGTKNPLTGPNGVLKRATLLLSLIAGIAAVIMIIVSGFRYTIAGGDAQKAASARNGIFGAVIGLAIIALSTTIVIFIVSKL